jgi:hypothetical protein
MATTSDDAETVDYAAECIEAFRRMAREHAAINPAEMGKRLQNAKLRERKRAAIDAVLDQYLIHVAVTAHEPEFAP